MHRLLTRDHVLKRLELLSLAPLSRDQWASGYFNDSRFTRSVDTLLECTLPCACGPKFSHRIEMGKGGTSVLLEGWVVALEVRPAAIGPMRASMVTQCFDPGAQHHKPCAEFEQPNSCVSKALIGLIEL